MFKAIEIIVQIVESLALGKIPCHQLSEIKANSIKLALFLRAYPEN